MQRHLSPLVISHGSAYVSGTRKETRRERRRGQCCADHGEEYGQAEMYQNACGQRHEPMHQTAADNEQQLSATQKKATSSLCNTLKPHGIYSYLSLKNFRNEVRNYNSHFFWYIHEVLQHHIKYDTVIYLHFVATKKI